MKIRVNRNAIYTQIICYIRLNLTWSANICRSTGHKSTNFNKYPLLPLYEHEQWTISPPDILVPPQETALHKLSTTQINVCHKLHLQKCMKLVLKCVSCVPSISNIFIWTYGRIMKRWCGIGYCFGRLESAFWSDRQSDGASHDWEAFLTFSANLKIHFHSETWLLLNRSVRATARIWYSNSSAHFDNCTTEGG